MVTDQEKARHWRYYLLLEGDLAEALRFVEPDPANDGSFSLEFAKQMVAVGAQFETVARLYCLERVPPPPPSLAGIGDIKAVLLQLIPELPDAEALFLWRNEPVRPFAPWKTNSALPWWTAYRELKHDPAHNLAKATLVQVFTGVAALGLLTQLHCGIANTGLYRKLFALNWAYRS